MLPFHKRPARPADVKDVRTAVKGRPASLPLMADDDVTADEEVTFLMPSKVATLPPPPSGMAARRPMTTRPPAGGLRPSSREAAAAPASCPQVADASSFDARSNTAPMDAVGFAQMHDRRLAQSSEHSAFARSQEHAAFGTMPVQEFHPQLAAPPSALSSSVPPSRVPALGPMLPLQTMLPTSTHAASVHLHGPPSFAPFPPDSVAPVAMSAAPPSVAPLSIGYPTDPPLDPPRTVITTRTRVLVGRPTVSWAAALVAMGVFAGLVTAVLARGDGAGAIDATASVEPAKGSSSDDQGAARASDIPPADPLPGAAPAAPVTGPTAHETSSPPFFAYAKPSAAALDHAAAPQTAPVARVAPLPREHAAAAPRFARSSAFAASAAAPAAPTLARDVDKPGQRVDKNDAARSAREAQDLADQQLKQILGGQ